MRSFDRYCRSPREGQQATNVLAVAVTTPVHQQRHLQQGRLQVEDGQQLGLNALKLFSVVIYKWAQ